MAFPQPSREVAECLSEYHLQGRGGKGEGLRLFSNPSLKSLAPLLLKNKGTKGVRFTNDLDGLSPPGQAATMPKAVAYQFILYETQGNIARLVLNRPALNTWDYPGQGGIADEFYS